MPIILTVSAPHGSTSSGTHPDGSPTAEHTHGNHEPNTSRAAGYTGHPQQHSPDCGGVETMGGDVLAAPAQYRRQQRQTG